MMGEETIYRRLQRHLDRQAVGFPAVRSGADIRLLKRLFTPEEAGLALHLSHRPAPADAIVASTAGEFSREDALRLLDNLVMKGVIGWQDRDGVNHWYVIPLVIGMYEGQGSGLAPEFLADAEAYMRTLSYGRSFLAVKPSQMRTIPIHRSIPVERPVATYDQIRALVENAQGPFVVLPCICRQGMAIRHKPCTRTARLETCLGLGRVASLILRRKHGREISREEALTILGQNEEDGLVFQPANAQHAEFVCSCCGCCCGMLAVQKMLPRPVDFWTSNFFAEVDAAACVRCGQCVDRCQVNAVALTGAGDRAAINRSRCIGCGLCVPTCEAHAIRLRQKAPATVPPADEEALYGQIAANRKGAWRQWIMLLKTALRIPQ